MKASSLKPVNRHGHHPDTGMPEHRQGTVELRRAAYEDLPALISLINEHAAFERAPPPEVCAQSLADTLFDPAPRLYCWVAVSDAVVAGYMTAAFECSTWSGRQFLHMDCLYVHACYRSQGIGAQLIGALREFALAAGVAEIQWQTPHWNEDAARFYSRLGAVESMKRRFFLR
jgi:GNAT superfamily N-acetyltransferase